MMAYWTQKSACLYIYIHTYIHTYIHAYADNDGILDSEERLGGNGTIDSDSDGIFNFRFALFYY